MPYNSFELTRRYISYYLRAKNLHGIHSPFVYSLVRDVVYNKSPNLQYADIERLRKELSNDNTRLHIADFGAGSRTQAQHTRTVAEIARNMAKLPKYSQLLYRLCRYFKPINMLELGTSLGISAAYQAKGALEGQPAIHFTTIEGSPEIAAKAIDNFEKLGIRDHITSVTGNFDDVLGARLKNYSALDYVFFDGNHRLEPTLRYFEQCLPLAHNDTMFVFDDIHWSLEMEQAWETIKNNPRVTVTIDLFFNGLVFFRSEQQKEHFTVRF